MLENIKNREDILALSSDEEEVLCQEIRDFLIKHVSRTGGHLASNLGVVELTLALHKVYDTAEDRLLFDVGHQSYVHKILTGRMEQFHTLRTYGGLAGFPKPSESNHDAFIAGHASDTVSVALGMARARTLNGRDYSVVAVLGDGALTGGLAYEGLNDAGESGEGLVVVLNDNGMSIQQNVGAVARYLSLVRLKPGYFGLKKLYRQITNRLPCGKTIYELSHRAKTWMRKKLIGVTLFEEMGFEYLGPVDGHDVDKLTFLLEQAKDMNVPVLLHVITKKGKGYAPAEVTPEKFHGVGSFDPSVGLQGQMKSKSFSEQFGSCLCQLAKEDSRVCAITAAMEQGTGLAPFANVYPERYFDVGIAEGHAVAMAAGLAKQGMIPVFAVYSTFLQRAYDMLMHDVSLLGLHIVLAVDRAGLVGEDGETHHGVFDVGYLRQVPGMQILCPASHEELSRMLRQAVLHMSGPVAVRYPRGCSVGYEEQQWSDRLQDNAAVTLVTYGTTVNLILAVAELLKEDGICSDVIKLDRIAPLETEQIEISVRKTGRLVIVEEVAHTCGVGVEILASLMKKGITCRSDLINLGDGIVPHGDMDALRKHVGMDSYSIYQTAKELVLSET